MTRASTPRPGPGVSLAALVLLGVGACSPVEGVRRRPAAALDHGDQEMVTSAAAIDTSWAHSDGWAVSPLLDVTGGATRVSALLSMLSEDAPAASMEARGSIEGEPVTDWAPLAVTFAEGEARVALLDLPARVDAIEVRVAAGDVEGIAELRFAAVDLDATLGEDAAADDASEGVAREALRADLRGMGIVTREEWGAQRGTCSSRDGARRRISIHHTEGGASDPARQLRSVQSYHLSKGWCDVGYHFLVGSDGRIYEGRPLELLGAHVRDNNAGNLGVAFIGCFDSRDCASPTSITDAMIESAGRLVGTLGELHSIAISSSTVRAHRDQVSTSCPGDHLYARIADIVRVGQSSRLGSEAAPPPAAPDPAPPADAVCRHSLGGTYAAFGCSEGYQCCAGRWRSRASGCGSCACVESSGSSGCTPSGAPPATPPAEPPAPSTPPPASAPAGASCTHSFGGVYAPTACSASYQCCDGAWRARSSGCGTCFCVEESGTSGCGGSGTPPTPPLTPALPYAGLTLSGSEIPRSGLANATLRSALGLATEPYGSLETYEGVSWVRGRVSWFGGPRDTGVTTTETGAITGERLRSLNDPVAPSATVLGSRPADYYYVAMRWAYAPNGTRWWRDARLVVVNPATGAAIVVRPVDWGPNTSTRRILDLSPQALADLGLSTDGEALVAFAPAGTPLGRVAR